MSQQPVSGPATTERDLDHRSLKIEFLYSDDCPSHERALALLQEVLNEHDIDATIRIQQIETEREAEQFRFPGSPTIRIEDIDIDDHPDLPIGLACRAYRDEMGRISSLPPRNHIATAIQRATEGPPIETSNSLNSCR